jgi:hypothetical protein
MINAHGSGALADRKIHARVFEHPFGIFVFRNHGFGVE